MTLYVLIVCYAEYTGQKGIMFYYFGIEKEFYGWTVVGESIFTISVMIHIRDIKQQHILTPMYQSILRMIT